MHALKLKGVIKNKRSGLINVSCLRLNFLLMSRPWGQGSGMQWFSKHIHWEETQVSVGEAILFMGKPYLYLCLVWFFWIDFSYVYGKLWRKTCRLSFLSLSNVFLFIINNCCHLLHIYSVHESQKCIMIKTIDCNALYILSCLYIYMNIYS